MTETSAQASSQLPETAPAAHAVGRQFSLRFLGVVVTLWCCLIALAAPTWGNCIPLLAFCALLTACLFGLGEFLERHVLLRYVMATMFGIGLVAAFLLPVLPDVAIGQIIGWEVFKESLRLPAALYESFDFSRLLSWGEFLLAFCTVTISAGGTIAAFPAIIAACWPRDNWLRAISRFTCGIVVATAAAVPLIYLFLVQDAGDFSVFRELRFGYYVWLICLTGIWLVHVPKRHWTSWALFGWAAFLLALTNIVEYLVRQIG